jgi:hypothetical protein
MIVIRWYPFGAYEGMRLSQWLFSAAHDRSSLFWRVCGLEIYVPRE